MTRGFTTKEIGLALSVLIIAAGLVLWVGSSLTRRDSTTRDVDRMRHLYLSISMYESDNQGWLPPDLLTAKVYVPEDIAYQSTGDPYTSSGAASFPSDGGMPDWQVVSSVRISFAYLYAFVSAKKAVAKPWYEQKYDRNVGLIADEWQGKVSPTNDFNANVSGVLLRLNTDGALHTAERAESTPIGNPQTLFFAPAR